MADDFPQMLKALRTGKGLSQRAVAEAVSVHPSYISKLEKGEERPAREFVEALAQALGADPVQLALAAGYVRGEFATAIAEHAELQRLLGLASKGRLSAQFYASLTQLLNQEDRILVPVWLEGNKAH